MQTTWIVVADSSRARIFEKRELDAHLEEVDDFVNAAGRAEYQDINTDRGGSFGSKGGAQTHTSQPQASPAEHSAELFSREVTQFLDEAHDDQRYERLCVIAAPKFLGLLRSNLSKRVEDMVEEELPKDISNFTARQIEDYVDARLNLH